MASNLLAVTSNLDAWRSFRVLMVLMHTTNLLALASNLGAMASNVLELTSNRVALSSFDEAC